MVTPIWFAMAARELSWGAVFMTPLSISPETGPTFSSRHQLAYSSAVAPVLVLLALGCLWIFIRSQQYRTLAALWRQRSFPVAEIVLFAAGMVVSAACEGHLGLNVPLTAEWARQNLEELAELWAYLALVAAQYRVWRGFRR